MAVTCIRGRKPTHNLLDQGWESIAAWIAQRIASEGNTLSVYVCRDGWVRLVRPTDTRETELPAEWLVGTYRKRGLCIGQVEIDLLNRERELRMMRMAA